MAEAAYSEFLVKNAAKCRRSFEENREQVEPYPLDSLGDPSGL